MLFNQSISPGEEMQVAGFELLLGMMPGSGDVPLVP